MTIPRVKALPGRLGFAVIIGLAATLGVVPAAPAHASVGHSTVISLGDEATGTSPVAIGLDDGRALFIDASQQSPLSRVYDPVRSRFQESGYGPSPVRFGQLHPAVAKLTDGRVIAVGGTSIWSQSETKTTAAGLYDPVTNNWHPIASFPIAFANGVAVALKDGRALVATGARAAIYDPDSDSWSETAAVPDPLDTVVGTRLTSGRVLLVGRGAASYDTATDTWTQEPPPPTAALSAPILTALPSGDALLLWGATTNPGPALIYSDVGRRWRFAGDPGFSLMPTSAVVSSTGRVFVYGQVGLNDALRVFDPTTDLWAPAGAPQLRRTAMAAMGDGSLLLLGGDSFGYTVEVFQPGLSGSLSTPPAGSTVARLAAPTSIPTHSGRATSVVGRLLNDDTGQPLPGQTVDLWTRPSANSDWSHAASAATTSLGEVSFVVTPTATTVWALRHPASATASQSAADVTAVLTAVARPPAVSTANAQAANAAAYLEWGTPLDDGGSAITAYQITGGPKAVKTTSTARTLTMTGLANGHTYKLAIAAVNAKGVGPATTLTVVPSASATSVSDIGAHCGTLPVGVTTWSATSGPHSICRAGIVIPEASTLVLDGSKGALTIALHGSSPFKLVDGAIRSVGTAATRHVVFKSSTATPWAGITATGPTPAQGATGSSIVGLDYADLAAGSLSITRGGMARLANVTRTAAATSQAVTLVGTPLLLSAAKLKGGGVSTVCTAPCWTSVTGVTVDGASGSGLMLTGISALDIRDLVVTNSGRTSPISPAARFLNVLATVGTTGNIRPVTGGGNGIDAIELDGTVTNDLTWVSPVNALAVHPLGFIAGDLTIMANRWTVPTGAVVKVVTSLKLQAADLDASAGGATFTSTADSGVAPASCPSVFGSCDTKPTWTGLIVNSAKNVTLNAVKIRYAKDGLSAGSDHVAITDSIVELCERGIDANATDVSLVGTTVRDVVIPVTLGGGHVLVDAVTVVGGKPKDQFPVQGGITINPIGERALTIRDSTVSNVQGPGLVVNRALHPTIHNITLRGNGAPAVKLWDGTWSIGPGKDIDGLSGSANLTDAVEVSGTITDDLGWLTPVARTTDGPLGYYLGESRDPLGQYGLRIPSGVTLTIPSNAVVKSLMGIRVDGGSVDASAGGAAFASVADDSVGPVLKSGYLDGWPLPVLSMPAVLGSGADVTLVGATVHGLGLNLCGGVHLHLVHVLASGVKLCGPGVHVDGLTVDGAPDIGLDFTATESVVPADWPTPDIHHVVVTNSAVGKFSPAVRIKHVTVTLDDTGSVTDVAGGGNGVDELDFSGLVVDGDFTWVTPHNDPTVHPLGYATDDTITVTASHQLTVPDKAIVKGSLVLDGATLDATVGHSTFTAYDDLTVDPGPQSCEASWCRPAGAKPATITIQGAGGASFENALVNELLVVDSTGGAPADASYALTAKKSALEQVDAQGPVFIDHSNVYSGVAFHGDGKAKTVVDSYVTGYAHLTAADIQTDVILQRDTLRGANTGLVASPGAQGVFDCLDIRGLVTGAVLKPGNGYAPDPIVAFARSNLIGNPVALDNPVSTTTTDTWWGQPGGPTSGQVTHPDKLTDVAPRDDPSECAGAPTAPLPSAPAHVHASPRALRHVLLTWQPPAQPAGEPIVSTSVVCSCGERWSLTGAPDHFMVQWHGAGSYAIHVTTGSGDSSDGVSNTIDADPGQWPTVNTVTYSKLADASNVGSFPISAKTEADATVTFSIFDFFGVTATASDTAGEDGFVHAVLDLSSMRNEFLYVRLKVVDAGGTPLPNDAYFAQDLLKSTSPTPSAPQNIRCSSLFRGINLEWTSPTNTNGRTVVSYLVTNSPGGASQTIPANGNYYYTSFSGLHNGTAYTITITPHTSSGNLLAGTVTCTPPNGSGVGSS
jgi:hypothetical protein